MNSKPLHLVTRQLQDKCFFFVWYVLLCGEKYSSLPRNVMFRLKENTRFIVKCDVFFRNTPAWILFAYGGTADYVWFFAFLSWSTTQPTHCRINAGAAFANQTCNWSSKIFIHQWYFFLNEFLSCCNWLFLVRSALWSQATSFTVLGYLRLVTTVLLTH